MKIHEIMKARRFTIAELARQMGVAPASVVSMINGNPTANNLKKIAAVLGCRVGDFFEDEGPAAGADERGGEEQPEGSGGVPSVRNASGGAEDAATRADGNFSEVPERSPARGFEGSGPVCRCPHCGGAVALGLLPVGVFGDAKFK